MTATAALERLIVQRHPFVQQHATYHAQSARREPPAGCHNLRKRKLRLVFKMPPEGIFASVGVELAAQETADLAGLGVELVRQNLHRIPVPGQARFQKGLE